MSSMTIARSTIVPEDEAGVYHCMSRCVRRSWLCGVDPYNGEDYSHRKGWAVDKLKELAGIFAIEVYAYAIMSNHLHVVLRIDPGKARGWSDREVVRRWKMLFPWERDSEGNAVSPSKEQMEVWEAQSDKVAVWRERLGNLSWMMRCLNEPLARRANREDGCGGSFWEGRFKSQRLCDGGAVLACMAYVDLNPVRAAQAGRPEDGDMTSVKLRFEAERARMAREENNMQEQKAHAQRGQKKAVSIEGLSQTQADWLTPVEKIKLAGETVEWGIGLREYLELVDETGRRIAEGKQGSLSPCLQPVVERLELNARAWVGTVEGYGGKFQRLAGCRERLVAAAKAAGRRWFCRGKGAEEVYAEPGVGLTV